MGYASRVALAIDCEAFATERAKYEMGLNQELKPILDPANWGVWDVHHKAKVSLWYSETNQCESRKVHVWMADGVNWYDGYSLVEAVTKLIGILEDARKPNALPTYGFIRTGEGEGDTEEQGDPYDFDLYTETVLHIPEPVSEEE